MDLDQPGWSEVAPDGGRVWCEARVRELLAAAAGDWLFVSGCAENQVKFHSRFDATMFLSAPEETIVRRLATRTNHPYGKQPEEVARVLGYIGTVEPRLRRVADYEVDTRGPLGEVVARVLQLVGAVGLALSGETPGQWSVARVRVDSNRCSLFAAYSR